jgi:hypothetical protein
MNLRELAEELDELREEFDLGVEGKERLEELSTLEKTLGGDLHAAANHGMSLIAEGDFKQHAMEMAENLGHEINGWPYDAIDWDEAADTLKSDYTAVEFDGETYYTTDL